VRPAGFSGSRGPDDSYFKQGQGYRIKEVPVADRGRSVGPPFSVVGLAATGNPDFYMRRTARDAVPPRRVVTAQILGDPRPGRSAQDAYERAKLRALIVNPSVRIHGE
jgi:hypothetical protein